MSKSLIFAFPFYYVYIFSQSAYYREAIIMLTEELSKLSGDQLKRIAEVWNPPKIPSDKKQLVVLLKKMSEDEYFLKGVLEKLTPMQVMIFSTMIGSRTVLTLGEISRKIKVPVINVEQELAVIKHLMLVYQRKNRERLTNTLDKYYPFDEIKSLVSIDRNDKGEKFQISIKRELNQCKFEGVNPKYKALVGKFSNPKEGLKLAVTSEVFEKILATLSDQEINLLDEAFVNGGVLEIHSARIIIDEQKLPLEETLRKMHEFYILKDVYFIDERYVRALVIPIELFEYLKSNPLFPTVEGVKERTEKTICNELDFSLNLKKMLLFISNKGLTLSQSEKLKQADLKRSESYILNLDLSLFPEKSQVHQIEIILPFLKYFDLVDLKDENIVLNEAYEEFLKRDPLELIEELMHMIPEISEKRQVGSEVFLPIEVPFFKKDILKKCLEVIVNQDGIYVKVLLAELIREWVVMSPEFRVRSMKSLYIEKKTQIISAIFYMQIFGLLSVDYPKRRISISSLGNHYFFKKDLKEEDEPGAVIVNPDGTLIAMPDKLSLKGLHVLKTFTKIKEIDRVYTFQITKDSLQDGLLLGHKPEEFTEFLTYVTKNRVPQNVMFLISDWTEDLPIVSIEEGVVLVETSDVKLTELLMGQLKGKKIIRKVLSDTALIVVKSKVQEVMDVCDKLEMIVKLIR